MRTTFFLIPVAALIFSLAACKKDPGNNNNNGAYSYSMQVRMTDAAGAYDAVYIDVQSVQVNTDANGAENGWQTLTTRAGIYDVSKLSNGTDTLLANGTLSSSSITQVRLILGTNNSVVIKGQSYPLDAPSAQQSGLKLNVHYTLVAGATYVMLLDFDCSRSIVSKGNGGYSLKPVIRSSSTATSGSIRGTISPASLSAVMYAVSGSDSAGTFNDLSGSFMFKGMSAGTYNLAIVPLPPLSIKMVNNVQVTNGSVTDVGVITIP